jgi:hypothetical protein
MKRDFTNDHFEEFLKQSADSLRMKAPDKVWQNLSKELNKRRRRFIIGLSVFLLISSGIGYYTIAHVTEPIEIRSKQTDQHQNIIAEQPTEKISSFNLPLAAKERTSLPTESFNNTSAVQNKEGKKVREADISSAQPINTAQSNESSENNLVAQSPFTPTVVDSYTEFDNQESIDEKDKQPILISRNETLPLTIESVINSYKLKGSKAKLETQFYFVPTISYRKLTENKSYLRALSQSNTPSNYPAFHSSVNNNVTHKPDVGFELGLAVKYPVSSKVKLRTGLQFNVNRYDVKAFSSAFSVATIALNNRSGPDSLNTISNYSNINGYKSNWLQNLSFQVSAPVGVELNLGNSNKVQFGIAGTIQPTYVLGDRAYLITTDYKNYAQVPWLVRRWNVNTALETFITYNTGKTKWQFGPQVRYQLLSSFISEYPVKENLFDFGFKIGVSANRK